MEGPRAEGAEGAFDVESLLSQTQCVAEEFYKHGYCCSIPLVGTDGPSALLGPLPFPHPPPPLIKPQQVQHR